MSTSTEITRWSVMNYYSGYQDAKNEYKKNLFIIYTILFLLTIFLGLTFLNTLSRQNFDEKMYDFYLRMEHHNFLVDQTISFFDEYEKNIERIIESLAKSKYDIKSRVIFV